MLNSKIVFILGAGAGCEIGMPLGSDLANRIADKMSVELDSIGRLTGGGDHKLFQQVADKTNYTPWLAAAKRLKAGIPLSKSIDDFLDVHRRDELMVALGKAAIVRSILEAERSSKLFFEAKHIDDSIDFVPISGTWLVRLMHMLGKGDPDAVFDDVGFINFNYDRCLEHFLFYAVRGLYALDADRAREIVGNANIIHPYGFIGLTPELGGNIPYGYSTANVSDLISKIKTYTEVSEKAVVASIGAMIKDAAAFIFLGFGYDKQNMNLLMTRPGLQSKKVYGTAKGVSSSDKVVVESRIRQLFHADAHGLRELTHIHTELDCAGLVSSYTLTWPEI